MQYLHLYFSEMLCELFERLWVQIWQISCVIALFFFRTLLESVFHGYFVLVFIFFFNFNFRKHCNIGSNTILIELLKFRSKSRITVTLLTVIYCENWEYEFFEYYALLLFFLEAILQGVAKNKPTEKQVDAENQMTLKHAPAYLSFQIAKIDLNYNLQLLASEHQKQTPGGILWKRCS